MGLTLQFAIGDKFKLINAAKDFDFDLLNKLENENQLADFSLHLIPDDLNLLVNAATELKQIPIYGLRENIDTEIYYFDLEESGAYLVDKKIVALFSTFDDKNVLPLTEKWFEKMNIAHNEELEVTDAAIDSVQHLISISRNAMQNNADMVHIWFL
ncbi:MAG TPA: hypothetical protein VKT28_07025 [Puia sp.]|nr:hypothetical protein [Puia sp.]